MRHHQRQSRERWGMIFRVKKTSSEPTGRDSRMLWPTSIFLLVILFHTAPTANPSGYKPSRCSHQPGVQGSLGQRCDQGRRREPGLEPGISLLPSISSAKGQGSPFSINPPTRPPHSRHDAHRPLLASRHLTFFPSFHVAAVFVSCFASFFPFCSLFSAESASHFQLNDDEAGLETNHILILDIAHRLTRLDTTPTTDAAIPQGFSTLQFSSKRS